MVTRVRSTVVIAMIWLATVACVSATAWFAIDRAGRSITGVDVSSLQVPAGVPVPTATPSPSPSGPSSPSSSAPSTAQHDRSVNLPAGQVSVRCAGTTIRLRIAQPANGWKVEVNEAGPLRVDVEFKLGEEGSESEPRVRAACKNGVPEFSVENKG
jgi:hypothetical protein